MRYPCPECEFVATRADTLKRQIERKQKGVGYPCSPSDYVATRSSYLKSHIESSMKDPDILVRNVSFLQLEQTL